MTRTQIIIDRLVHDYGDDIKKHINELINSLRDEQPEYLLPYEYFISSKNYERLNRYYKSRAIIQYIKRNKIALNVKDIPDDIFNDFFDLIEKDNSLKLDDNDKIVFIG